jgi:hypothetical protein
MLVRTRTPADTGVPFNQSYRHFRVNQVMRAVAQELGVLVIDVERYWFSAVAVLGNDALFSAGQTVHPNLLGYQLSYQAAINDFADTLVRPAISPSRLLRTSLFADPVAIASGGTLTFSVPANSEGSLTVRGGSGGAWESIWTGSFVANASRVTTAQASTAFTTPGNWIASVVGSSTALTITIATTATGAGGTLAWQVDLTQ